MINMLRINIDKKCNLPHMLHRRTEMCIPTESFKAKHPKYCIRNQRCSNTMLALGKLLTAAY